MSTATNATRTFVTSLFETISRDGLGPSFIAALSDNVKWTATGSSPLSGVFNGKKAYQDDVLGKLRGKLEYAPRPAVIRILADGEWAAVYFHSKGAKAAGSGMDFGMEYCWLLKVQGEKIVEVVGFFDQKKVYDLFAQ